MPQTGGATLRGGLNETTRNHLDRQRAEVDTFADLATLTDRCPAGHICYVKDEQLHYKLLNDLETWVPAAGEAPTVPPAEAGLGNAVWWKSGTRSLQFLVPDDWPADLSRYRVRVVAGAAAPPPDPDPDPNPNPNPNPAGTLQVWSTETANWSPAALWSFNS